jgi:peptidoglycan/xylan/chitin deacetylase (PgdA/CDA1 family)
MPSTISPRRLALVIMSLAFILATIAGLFASPSSVAVAANPTVVTIGFDDGNSDSYQARAILAAHGMHATYYVNTAVLDTAGHLTWAQLQDLYADGNEIAGHTLTHANLKKLKNYALRHEICDDRVALLNHGFPATSFAYPFGSYNSTTVATVQQCGYNSARTVSGDADTIPPANPYTIHAFPSVKGSTSLATLQGWVMQVEAAGGGWVHLVLHHVCTGSGCDVYSISPATLDAFLAWLQARAANGTVVKTNAEVIGGTVKPPIPAQ